MSLLLRVDRPMQEDQHFFPRHGIIEPEICLIGRAAFQDAVLHSPAESFLGPVMRGVAVARRARSILNRVRSDGGIYSSKVTPHKSFEPIKAGLPDQSVV